MTPQGPFTYLKRYEISINARPYGFYTLTSKDGVIAWMPDNEQQYVNPQYRGGEKPTPVFVEGANKWDIGRIIQQVMLFQTKEMIPLEDIVNKYNPLVSKILADFKSYHKQIVAKPT